MPRKRCQPEAPLCQQCGCEMPAATYAYGRRYDHPNDTSQYLLDTMRAILDELHEMRSALTRLEARVWDSSLVHELLDMLREKRA